VLGERVGELDAAAALLGIARLFSKAGSSHLQRGLGLEAEEQVEPVGTARARPDLGSRELEGRLERLAGDEHDGLLEGVALRILALLERAGAAGLEAPEVVDVEVGVAATAAARARP